MALKVGTKIQIRDVTGISAETKQRIRDFLQGAVYCWCNNKPDEWFSLRDFMGGYNFYWQGTPLIELYIKHKNLGKSDEDAFDSAAIDGGWLLKKVIIDDKRLFDTKIEDRIRKYKWIKNND